MLLPRLLPAVFAALSAFAAISAPAAGPVPLPTTEAASLLKRTVCQAEIDPTDRIRKVASRMVRRVRI